MRQFASSGFRIWNLSPEAKLVYTGFGLLALLALAVSVMLYEDMVGPRSTAGSIDAYYVGRDGVTPAKAPEVGGPKIELGDEPKPVLGSSVSYRKLLETTHFHLFTVPIFVLVIAHLFMMTGLGTRTKVWLIAFGWLSSAAHLAAPWLVRYGGRSWAWMFALSGAVMAVTLTIMTVVPIVSMWTGRSPRATDKAA
jgi:hypothetical protein